jgi:DNA modification methylase
MKAKELFFDYIDSSIDFQVKNGDALSAFQKFEDEKFDLIITSPPYNIGKSYETGHALLSLIELKKEFNFQFHEKGWSESRYNYYITLNRELMEKSVSMPAKEQQDFLISNGEDKPIYSYNQTDFVKDKIKNLSKQTQSKSGNNSLPNFKNH